MGSPTIPCPPGRLARRVAPAIVLLVLWAALGPAVIAWPRSQAGPTIRLVPSSRSVVATAASTVDVVLENASNLYGAHFYLRFDPAIVEVRDVDATRPGVQIAPGPFLPGADAPNTASNADGTINYAVTLLAPSTPVSGSGTVATITFRGKAPGVSAVRFISTTLSGPPDAPPIALAGAVDGQVVVSPAPPTPAPYSERWRFGVVLDPSVGPITAYDTGALCAGWYIDRRANPDAPPVGLDYVQVIRVGASAWPTDTAALAAKVAAAPGSTWLVGYEPDCRYQDNRLPADYARIYHDAYQLIKAADPTAQVGNGPLAQASTLRIAWLNAVWAAYQSQYGSAMPVDVWATNGCIHLETSAGMGVGIPPGSSATSGLSFVPKQDADSMVIFSEQVRRLRQWMKDHGQQDKPLILTEVGVPYFVRDWQYQDRVIEFMHRAINYLLYTADASLGMPGDGNRLVQRFAWYSLNRPPAEYSGNQPGSTGNLYGVDSHSGAIVLTRFGVHYARLACDPLRPTPTPSTTPAASWDRREAEDALLVEPLVVFTGADASYCEYMSGYPKEGGQADLWMYAPVSGNYVLWGRARGMDEHNNSFNISIDYTSDADCKNWVINLTPTPGSLWKWVRVNDGYHGIYEPNAVVWTLGRGWHRIRIDAMEGRGCRLDALALVPVGDTTNAWRYEGPCGLPTDTPTVTRTPTATLSPTATRTPTSTTTPTLTRTPTRTLTPSITRTPTRTLTPTITRTPAMTATPLPSGPGVVNGRVAYQGHGTPPAPSWQQPLTLTVHLPGNPAPAYSFAPTSDTNGHFSVTGVLTGTYDVYVRDRHSLRNVRRNVSLNATSPLLDLGTLIEGDCNTNGAIDFTDLSMVALAFGKSSGQAGYDPRTDLTDNGAVDFTDLSLAALNFGRTGDQQVTTAPQMERLGQAAAQTSAVLRMIESTTGSTSVTRDLGQTFSIVVKLDTNGNTVSGIRKLMSFNPAYLQVDSLSQAGSPFGWLGILPSFNNSTGVIDGGMAFAYSGTTANNVTYLTINFRTRSTYVPGGTPLAFLACAAGDKNCGLKNGAEDVPYTTRGATVYIVSLPTATPTITPTPEATATPTATIPPANALVRVVPGAVTVGPGEPFSVTVTLDTRSHTTSGIHTRLAFDPNYLQVEGVDAGGPPLSWPVDSPSYDNATGIVDGGHAVAVGGTSDDGLTYVTVHFRARESPVIVGTLLAVTGCGDCGLKNGAEDVPYTTQGGVVYIVGGVTPTATPGKGEIRGMVYEDRDRNGVLEEGEPPLAGARVTLRTAAGAFLRQQETGSEGVFLFVDLAPGAYRVVEADPPGYFSTTDNQRPVDIGAGETAVVDFGDAPYRQTYLGLITR